MGRLPLHVAIIMDGNGRWAKKRGLPRVYGHREGAKRVEEIVLASKKLGIRYLTLFVFSTENWARPTEEVEFLFSLLEEYLLSKIDVFLRENIRILVAGAVEELPLSTRKVLEDVVERTKDCDGLILVAAINYGGRREIVEAVNKIVEDVRAGVIKDRIDVETFRRYLYLPDLPDPDIVIRTSGEMRISNFLLWQIAYSELFFSPVLWPDFTEDEYIKIINEFLRRERRFGGITAIE